MSQIETYEIKSNFDTLDIAIEELFSLSRTKTLFDSISIEDETTKLLSTTVLKNICERLGLESGDLTYKDIGKVLIKVIKAIIKFILQIINKIVRFIRKTFFNTVDTNKELAEEINEDLDKYNSSNESFLKELFNTDKKLNSRFNKTVLSKIPKSICDRDDHILNSVTKYVNSINLETFSSIRILKESVGAFKYNNIAVDRLHILSKDELLVFLSDVIGLDAKEVFNEMSKMSILTNNLTYKFIGIEHGDLVISTRMYVDDKVIIKTFIINLAMNDIFDKSITKIELKLFTDNIIETSNKIKYNLNDAVDFIEDIGKIVKKFDDVVDNDTLKSVGIMRDWSKLTSMMLVSLENVESINTSFLKLIKG